MGFAPANVPVELSKVGAEGELPLARSADASPPRERKERVRPGTRVRSKGEIGSKFPSKLTFKLLKNIILLTC